MSEFTRNGIRFKNISGTMAMLIPYNTIVAVRYEEGKIYIQTTGNLNIFTCEGNPNSGSFTLSKQDFRNAVTVLLDIDLGDIEYD